MERVSIHPKERVWREPKPIRAPIVLWLGSHPLVTYPGQEEGLPVISFADADGGRGHGTTPNTSVTLGRIPGNTLTFDNNLTTISGNHARISLLGDVWHVEDLESLHGTFIENISACPQGETTLPPNTWRFISDESITAPLLKFGRLKTAVYTDSRDNSKVLRQSEELLWTGEPFVLPTHQPIQIGRGSENDIVLDNNYISFKHATIINTGNGILIRDRSPTNPTRVSVGP